jgi:hypothetical protein
MGAVAATMKDASTANQSIASGTLTLTTAASPGVGVAAAVTGLAPGSRANRFVVLTNGGTVAAQALTLTVTGTVSTLTGALQVTVDSCSIPWNGSFACTGTTTSIRTATPLNTLLGGSTTTIAASVAPGGTVNLRIGVSIASTAIITTDGVATYQGTTSNITWTFTQQQVAGATANS